MRALSAFALVALAACGPRPAPRTAATEKAAGPRLRLAFKMSDRLRGRASLSMDVDMGAGQSGEWGGQHLGLAFQLATLETVEAVDSDGTAHVRALLDDVHGAASQGGDPAKVEQFAVALSKVTVGFSRGTRGEVGPLELGELPPPLTDQMVRPMLNAVFAAQRGPILPAEGATPGQTWSERVALPEGGGFDGDTTYQYQLVREEAGRAVIACDVVITGSGGGKTTPRKLAGRSTDEYQLDHAAARFVATRIDTTLELEQTLRSTTTQVKQHVRAEWQRTQEGP
jgi:hypothetical protein